MLIFGYFVPLLVLIALVVATATIYVFWPSLRARPAQPAANAPEADEAPRVPATAPPTLYKGVNLLLGVVLSVFVAWAIEIAIYGTLYSIGPTTLAGSTSTRAIAHGFGWIGGGIVAVLFFIQGLQPAIAIGYKGMPTVIGGRSPVWLLHPEGWSWTIPYITGIEPENMRGRPLIDKENPEDEEVEVDALALVMPAPENAPRTKTLTDMEKLFFAPVKAKIVIRIQTFNPFVYRGFTDPESFLFGLIQQEVRLWVKDKQLFELPGLKADLQSHLEDKLDLAGKEMGIDFIKLAVNDIDLPEDVKKASSRIPVELIERSAQKYEAETVNQIVSDLKAKIPGLEARELKNMVLAIIGKGTSAAYSFEGNTPIPVVPVANAPKGG